MTVTTSRPADWMVKAGRPDGGDSIIATARGWERQMPNGTLELLHAMSGLGGAIISALITAMNNPADGNYEAFNVTSGTPATMDFLVSWAEAVAVTGVPRIAITVAGDETIYAEYVEMTDSNTAKFTLDLADLTSPLNATHAITAFGGATNVVELNGGTILSVDAGEVVSLDFAAVSVVADLAGVLVTVVFPAIVSIAEPAAGNYSAGTSDPMTWTVVFSEAVTLVLGATPLTLSVTDSAEPQQIPYASGSGTDTLVFTKTANLFVLGEIVGVNDPAIVLNTTTAKDVDGNDASLVLNADYVATAGIIVTA